MDYHSFKTFFELTGVLYLGLILYVAIKQSITMRKKLVKEKEIRKHHLL